jgi:hypothetical protein
MADDKKKAALKRALKQSDSRRDDGSERKIKRYGGAIKIEKPRMVLKRSAKYGKDRVSNPETAARNDDQERGTNLKKVKVKVKAASTKKASPVKSGKLGSGKAPKRNVLGEDKRRQVSKDVARSRSGDKKGTKTVKSKGLHGGDRKRVVSYEGRNRKIESSRKRVGENRSVDKQKTVNTGDRRRKTEYKKKTVVRQKGRVTKTVEEGKAPNNSQRKPRAATKKTPKKTVTRSGNNTTHVFSERRVVRK